KRARSVGCRASSDGFGNVLRTGSSCWIRVGPAFSLRHLTLRITCRRRESREAVLRVGRKNLTPECVTPPHAVDSGIRPGRCLQRPPTTPTSTWVAAISCQSQLGPSRNGCNLLALSRELCVVDAQAWRRRGKNN